jgi:hypothetical protein
MASDDRFARPPSRPSASKREQAHIKTWAHNRVVGVGIVFDEEVLGLGLVDKRRLEGVVDIGGDRLLAVAQRARATDSVRASQVEASSEGGRVGGCYPRRA